MTDTFKQVLKEKHPYDLNFAHEMAKQAIDTQDYRQSLRICQKALMESQEQGNHRWIHLFEDLIAKNMEFLKSNQDSKDHLPQNIIHQNATENLDDLLNISGVGSSMAQKLKDAGYLNIEQISQTSPKILAQIKGIGNASAEKIILSAREQTHKNLTNSQESIKDIISKKLVDEDFEQVNKDSKQKSVLSKKNLTQEAINKGGSKKKNYPFIENRNQDNSKNESRIFIDSKSQPTNIIVNLNKNNELEQKSKLLNYVKLTLEERGFKILPKEKLSSKVLLGIDFIAFKTVDISLSKKTLIIIPIKISFTKNKLIISEEKINLYQLNQKENLGNNSSLEFINSFLRSCDAIYGEIIRNNKFRQLLSSFLEEDLDIQYSSRKRSTIIISDTKRTSISIHPLLSVQKVPGFKEKAISFAYQRKNNLHIININEIKNLITFLEKKIRYVETFAHSNREYADIEVLKAKLTLNIRRTSFPFIGYGILFAFILVSGLYSLLKYFITFSYASVTIYLLSLIFLFLTHRKEKAKLISQFQQPEKDQTYTFDEGDLILIREELNMNEMIQFNYECFGKKVPSKLLEETEKNQIKQLHSVQSSKVNTKKMNDDDKSKISSFNQNKIQEKENELIKKYSSFLEGD